MSINHLLTSKTLKEQAELNKKQYEAGFDDLEIVAITLTILGIIALVIIFATVIVDFYKGAVHILN